jgi:hypothetical protein
MTTDATTSTAKTPQERAQEAAERLAGAGQPVTARAVREAAGVRMDVATEAAATWNAAQVVEAPPVPESVTVRVAGLWAEAWAAARATFDAERAGLAQAAQDARAERDAALADLESVQAAARDAAATAEASRADLAAQFDDFRAFAQKSIDGMTKHAELLDAKWSEATAELAQVTAERDQLRADLATLPAPTTKPSTRAAKS